MTQCNERGDNQTILDAKSKDNPIRTCPSCGHQIKCEDKQVLKFAKVFFLLLVYHCFLSTLIRSLCVLCFLVCSIKKQNEKKLQQAGIHDLPGLPAGVKFDPTDQEILEHLEGKVQSDACKLHPLIDEFIPTLEGENGICYTHPEKLPGEQYVKVQDFEQMHGVVHLAHAKIKRNI